VKERLVQGFLEFTNEYPWRWTAAHVDVQRHHDTES
jgi:hypothetical protein